MDLAAKHIGFVLASYAVATILLGALIATIIMRARRVRRRLAELEAAGARRRAAARGAGDGRTDAQGPATATLEEPTIREAS